jgi:hypothetical protein
MKKLGFFSVLLAILISIPPMALAAPTQIANSVSVDSTVVFNAFVPDVNDGVRLPRTRANFNVSEAYFYTTQQLTSTNLDDMLFFTTTQTRAVAFRINSTNNAYRMSLYQVDWSTGNAYATGVEISPNNDALLGSLPIGDWMWRIYSTGAVGSSYAAMMNGTNPSYTTRGIVQATADYEYVSIAHDDGEVYQNGTYLYNLDIANDELLWEREFYFSSGSGYTSRTQRISQTRITGNTTPCSYTSSYASSNNAVLLFVGANTYWHYFESQYVSGGPYYSSFDDTVGKTTPRRIDSDDVENWGPHYAVLDLDSGEIIDFFSILNFYYGAGIESIPTVTFYT